MNGDYHTHTPLCMHAEGQPEEYIDAALAAGLLAYGISDHAPALPEPFDDWRMRLDQLPDYLDWIERARAYAAGRIPVLAGLECDWLPDCHDHIQTLRNYHDWDYLIGSVHYLHDPEKWDFDNPAWLGKWAEIDVTHAWDTYWKSYTEMADSALFDIMGHPDLIKKFSHVPAGDLSRYYEPTIDAIATSGAIIELNTAGWHKPCAEQYPHLEFLELARDAGIDLIISSDAHKPNEVARDHARAREIARQAGYDQTVLLGKGTRDYAPL